MKAGRLSSPVRRTLVVHALSTLIVTVTVAVVSSLIAAVVAVEFTRRNTATAADAIAHTVAATLARTDIGVAGPETRTAVLDKLQPYLDAGTITRAKLWWVDGDEAVVLFSDEPRNEGVRRPFDPELAARLDRGDVVVLDVPDDSEHAHEFGEEGLLEAFIGFEDAAGRPMRLELYLRTSAARSVSTLLQALLPISAMGPLILGAATLPLALRLARRLDRREAERRALLETALAASDRERRRLAARLHDGIIQNLASVGLTLEALEHAAQQRDGASAATLARLSNLIDADITELRVLLTDLAPPELQGTLAETLVDLARDLQTASIRIHVDADDRVAVEGEDAALIYRVARELLRNAVEHSGATIVSVRLRTDPDGGTVLVVTDDGHGYDPQMPVTDGHMGLRLVKQAVADSGGRFDIESGASGTHVRVVVPPSRVRLPTA
ncbi:sensor histidine kinase [uncultured Aeromicrobium sp.]|uniref:sensor histidine kinase n=1 Tax=uncultured Aeromicrobium sp. TaxID=337820 RepID=UPI0025CE18EE|nr:ATP-binding protein [uncultured Aeromicrobium sp.]